MVHAGSDREIEASLCDPGGAARPPLRSGPSAFFPGRREQLIGLAARQDSAIYAVQEMAADGGLASFGYSVSDAFRRAGVYAGWILKGASPAELPILQSSKLELVIDLATARALGLDVPHNLPAGADELIQ